MFSKFFYINNKWLSKQSNFKINLIASLFTLPDVLANLWGKCYLSGKIKNLWSLHMSLCNSSSLGEAFLDSNLLWKIRVWGFLSSYEKLCDCNWKFNWSYVILYLVPEEGKIIRVTKELAIEMSDHKQFILLKNCENITKEWLH